LDQLIVKKGTSKTIQLNINIVSWFKTPHTWDFDYWGKYFMLNQDAMQEGKANGYDVFEVKSK
jgi:hypothetical protein